MSPKYTFLLPAYKAEFLGEALKSIFAQTISDFKIIVSDDCSPYHLDDIVKPFIEKYGDEKITYQRNAKNFGGERLVDHWNKLVSLCDSEFLIMASDDDIYSPRFLEETERLLAAHPNVDIVRHRVQRINEKDKVIGKEDIFDELQSATEATHSIFCRRYFGCIGNYVFRTCALKYNGGFINLPYAWFSDLLTVAALLGNGQANGKEIQFGFRLSGINISTTSRNKAVDRKKLEATIGYDRIMCQIIAKCPAATTLYEENMRNETIKAFKHRAYSQAGDYSWAVSLWQWRNIYKRMKVLPYFSKASFFKYFGTSVLNRWLGHFA